LDDPHQEGEDAWSQRPCPDVAPAGYESDTQEGEADSYNEEGIIERKKPLKAKKECCTNEGVEQARDHQTSGVDSGSYQHTEPKQEETDRIDSGIEPEKERRKEKDDSQAKQDIRLERRTMVWLGQSRDNR